MDIKQKFLLGVGFIFLLGSLLHFTYVWSGNNFLVGLFSAKNESVFEHSKLLLLPTLLWYVLSFRINRGKIDMLKYFSSMLISLVVSILSIPLMYYFIIDGLSLNSHLLNITMFLVAAFIGQCIAYHYYEYGKNKLSLFGVLLISLILIILFVYFSINPLNIPIFLIN